MSGETQEEVPISINTMKQLFLILAISFQSIVFYGQTEPQVTVIEKKRSELQSFSEFSDLLPLPNNIKIIESTIVGKVGGIAAVESHKGSKPSSGQIRIIQKTSSGINIGIDLIVTEDNSTDKKSLVYSIKVLPDKSK